MRALAIAPQPFFSPRGTPFSVYYRTLVLCELGVEVDLLTYGEGQDVDLPGVRIVRIPKVPGLGPIPIGPSLAKLLLDGVLVVWTVALLLRRRYDFVDAHEESVFFCRFLKPIFRFRLLYDMHSSLPQQLTNFRFTRSPLLIGLFAALERSCLAAADAVITISPELGRTAEAQMPEPRRHVLIENSLFEPVRLARSTAAPEGDAPDELQLPEGRPVVLYAGTFESYQGIDLLIHAFAEARRRRPEAFLLLVGGTPEQVEGHRRLAAAAGVREHVAFTGRLPPAAARDLVRRSAVVCSPRTHGTNTPLKVYELLASGVPLVATRILSHTQVLDDEVCWLAEPEPRALAAALVEALEDTPRRRRVVEAARARYESAYSRPVYERKMRRVLALLGAPESG